MMCSAVRSVWRRKRPSRSPISISERSSLTARSTLARNFDFIVDQRNGVAPVPKPVAVRLAIAKVSLDEDAVGCCIEVNLCAAHAFFRIEAFGARADGGNDFDFVTIPGRNASAATLRAEFDATADAERDRTSKFFRRRSAAEAGSDCQRGY